MPVKGVTHNDKGEIMTRVPVKYKVALGLPRGYEGASRPKKLFHFLVQSRDDKGKWQFDNELHKKLFGDQKKPCEIDIRLVGTNIEDMILGDLFFWSGSLGRRCSCGTTRSYLQQWCEQRGILWEPPLTEVQSQIDLETRIREETISKDVEDFLRYAEKLVQVLKDIRKDDDKYLPTINDVVNASQAERLSLQDNRYKPHACLFRQCPDYMFGDCKFNGRFFFSFAGDDHGEIAHVVTSSPKNIRNLQYGLQKMIGPAAKHGLNGVHCRLVGQPVAGSFMGSKGMQRTTYFLVHVMAPKGDPVSVGMRIASESKKNYKIFGDVRVTFDEGEEEQLAEERKAEFHEPEIVLEGEERQAAGGFKIGDEKGHKDRRRTATGFEKQIKEMVETQGIFKDDDILRAMVLKVAEVMSSATDSVWLRKMQAAFESSVIEKTVTTEKILESQDALKRHNVKADLKNYHAKLLKESEEQKPESTQKKGDSE